MHGEGMAELAMSLVAVVPFAMVRSFCIGCRQLHRLGSPLRIDGAVSFELCERDDHFAGRAPAPGDAPEGQPAPKRLHGLHYLCGRH